MEAIRSSETSVYPSSTQCHIPEDNLLQVMKHFIMQFSLLHLSSVQIYSSATCSQTTSVHVPPLMSETNFHTHTEPQAKVRFAYFIFYVFRQEGRRQTFLNRMVAIITGIQSALNFLMNENFDLSLSFPNLTTFSSDL
jgi:hypothetical protein